MAIAERMCDDVRPGSKRHLEGSCGDAIDHNTDKSFLALESGITAIFNLMEIESMIERRGPVPVAMKIAEKAGKVIGIWGERERRASQPRAGWDEEVAMSQAERRREKPKRTESPSNRDGDFRA